MDYGKLANNSYVVVATNVLRIAEALVIALDQMKRSGFDTEKLHIVAHSLGGQVAGYIGRKVSFLIPRITGEVHKIFINQFHLDFISVIIIA